VKRADGTKHQVELISAERVPIKRHIKVIGAANPYDLKWEEYFERRIDAQMSSDLKGRWKLLYLWRKQKGLCGVCHEKITRESGWHNHHVIWRVNGGTDKAENRMLLHPTCHRQVHSGKAKVVEPR
jgi:RNA-directed DNA polymerase